jgi:hypothetical protein
MMPRIFRMLALWVAFTASATEPWHYYVEPCRHPETGCRTSDPQLADWAFESWARASNGLLDWVRVKDPAKARLRVRWATVREGQFGETRRIRLGDRTVTNLYVLTDVKQLGPDIERIALSDSLYRDSIIYLTCVHEAGHALGLTHTTAFEDIMYSFASGGSIRDYFGRFRKLLNEREDIRKQSPITRRDQNRLLAILPLQ